MSINSFDFFCDSHKVESKDSNDMSISVSTTSQTASSTNVLSHQSANNSTSCTASSAYDFSQNDHYFDVSRSYPFRFVDGVKIAYLNSLKVATNSTNTKLSMIMSDCPSSITTILSQKEKLV